MEEKNIHSRRDMILITIYAAIILVACGAIWMSVFSGQGTIVIDDWATVMERRAADIPVFMEIRDRRWGTGEIGDNEVLFAIDALMKGVPRYSGELEYHPENYRMEGKITYIGGKNTSFSLGEVLWLEDEAYFGPDARDELAGIMRLMRQEVYNIPNLAALFERAQSVMIWGEAEAITPDDDWRELLHQGLLAAAAVTDSEEIDFALQTKGEPYCRLEITLSQTPGDMVCLIIYPNEYVEVMDMTSARGVVLYFYSDLFKNCRDALEAFQAES